LFTPDLALDVLLGENMFDLAAPNELHGLLVQVCVVLHDHLVELVELNGTVSGCDLN
jgi:hypothetical protein